MDWSSSGIKHEFAYELVDAVTLDSRGRWLDGVTGGTITESYRSEARSTCTLELDGSSVPWGCAVRVRHYAYLGAESFSEVLGTFQPEPMDSTYEYGRRSGSVDMYSSLKKLSTHFYKGVTGVAKGAAIVPHFKAVVADGQAVPWVSPSLSTSKGFGAYYAWVRPKESDYAEAQRCADALGAYLGVDAQGRVTLTPYVLPQKMSESWRLEGGAMLGVDIDEPDIVNRVVVAYEDNSGGKTKTYTAMATLADSSPWSYKKIGRFETVEANAPTFDDGVSASQIQTALDKLVAQELAAHQGKATYTVSALYDPNVRCATAGRFVYADSPADKGISARVFCSERQIDLTYGDMTLTLEEV